jgi:hypothetical protein
MVTVLPLAFCQVKYGSDPDFLHTPTQVTSSLALFQKPFFRLRDVISTLLSSFFAPAQIASKILLALDSDGLRRLI